MLTIIEQANLLNNVRSQEKGTFNNGEHGNLGTDAFYDVSNPYLVDVVKEERPPELPGLRVVVVPNEDLP